jgi:LemA protein
MPIAPLLLASTAGTVGLVVAGVLAAVVLLAGVSLYNNLAASRVRCDAAWSDIDVQLKRRHDLIPNVVEAVKAYAGYEKGTLETVVAARSNALRAAGPASQAQAEGELTGALKSLFALAESYPQLRASDQFTHLQQSLATIEDALQSSRRYYNAVSRDFNTAVATFPGNVVAGWGGFRPREYFELADSGERAVPGVKMDLS